MSAAAEARDSWPKRLDEKADRIAAWNDQIKTLKFDYLKRQHDEAVASLQRAQAGEIGKGGISRHDQDDGSSRDSCKV